jgi:hypothetical protein
VKFVEKDPDDAPPARLEAHPIDRARLARVNQFEIGRLQILDRPRACVCDDHVERDRLVLVCRRTLGRAELWRHDGHAM